MFKRKDMPYLQKKSLRKRIHERAKKSNVCFNCSEFNGVVKKCGVLKILHDKYKAVKKNEEMVKDMVESFCTAKEFNKELEPMINKSHEILNPLKVLFLFKNIPCEVSWLFFSSVSIIAQFVIHFFLSKHRKFLCC